MNDVLRVTTMALLVLAVAACDDDAEDGRDPDPEVALAHARVLHAVVDAPDVDIVVDGEIAADDLPFTQVTPHAEFEAGTYSVEAQAELPDGTTVTGIGPLDLTLEADSDVTIVATGKVIDDTLQAILAIRPDTEIDAEMVEFQGVHAAPDAPAVDVYATAADASIDGAAPVATFSFGEATEVIEGAAGDYRFRVTPAGDPSTVVFDSGETPVSVAGGASYVIAAIGNTGPGDSPIQLVVVSGDTSSVILDAGTPAEVKLAHAAPGVGAVDVFVSADGGAPTAVVDSLGFAEVTGLCTAAAGSYALDIAPEDQGAAAAVISSDVELVAGMTYSAVAAVIDEAPTAIVTEDDDRPVATQISFKVVNAADADGAASIFVTPAGESTLDEVLAGTVDATIADLAPGEVSPVIALTPGAYDLRVVADSGATLEIPGEAFEYAPGYVATVVLRGAEIIGDGPTAYGLLVLDNALCETGETD